MKTILWKTFKIMNYLIAISLFSFFSWKIFTIYKLSRPADINISRDTLGTKIDLAFDLKKHGKTKYFYGMSGDNYVWYNARLWRIVKKENNNVLMITEDSQTTLNWGLELEYSKSQIDQWLNHDVFYSDIADLSALSSNFVFNLLSETDYKRTGGNQGFINNETKFFLNNSTALNYVDEFGDVTKTKDKALTMGVRPTVMVRANSLITDGDGSLANPYTIGKKTDLTGKNIDQAIVGSYVLSQDTLWRINKKETSIRLISNDLMKIDGFLIKTTFGKTNNFKTSNPFKLMALNLKSDHKVTYYSDPYEIDKTYAYRFTTKQTSDFSLPGLGDLFATGVKDGDYFLVTPSNDNYLVLTIKTDNALLADSIESESRLRPVMAISKETKVDSGLGTLKKPYIIK